MYPYACDYDKWGFSDKNGNIKVPCKYEATYIVQGHCRYPQTIREDAYFGRTKGKLYILDHGKEIRFQEMDTMPVIYAIYNHYIVFKHHRKDEYQVYLRIKKKLLHQKFIQPPNIDTLYRQVYGAFVKDSSVVIDYNGKIQFRTNTAVLVIFGKVYLVVKDRKSFQLYTEKGKLLNNILYSKYEIVYGKDLMVLKELDGSIKILNKNVKIKDTKVLDAHIVNNKRIVMLIKDLSRDSMIVYDYFGKRLVPEIVNKIFWGDDAYYLATKIKTYKVSSNNEVLYNIDYSTDEIKGNTLLKYYGKEKGTYKEVIDSSYVFDKNLKFYKKFDGYVFNVFYDSLYFVVNESYNFLEDYKSDTIILCDKSMNPKKENKLRGSIYNQYNYGVWGYEYWNSKELRAGEIDYVFRNGYLTQMDPPPFKYLYIHKDRVWETDIECIIDTSHIKYNVIDYTKKYRDEAIAKERYEALEKARFENNRLFGYLNVNRDTIMPFIYEEGILHRNFITFEKDSIWTVFDTVTYEKTIYDRRHILSGLDNEILPNLFFTVVDTSKYIAHFVYHLEHGLLLEGRSVYDFSDYWEDFMNLKFEENGPEKLIHAPSGLLIDDYEDYQLFDTYTYKYDLEIFYKENHVFMSNNKTHKIDF
jgi:hypothetical protein